MKTPITVVENKLWSQLGHHSIVYKLFKLFNQQALPVQDHTNSDLFKLK